MTLEEKQHRVEKPSEEIKVLSGFRNVVTIHRRTAQILEIEDLLFHHDSAVMMPDALDGSDDQDGITGLEVVKTAYHHARDHQDQKLLIAGHTDASGPDAYNETLSRLRAENVLFVLLGERDPWVASAQNKSKVEDYQQILTWIAAWQGWPCDPGGIDNDHGSNTDAAVRAFQKHYSEADFGEEISVDGDVGKQTWGAFFRMYMKRLAELAETDDAGLAELRGQLKWLYDDLKVTGCGEYHPDEEPFVQGRRSQTNRRIELLFFEPGEEPPTKPGEICHAGGLEGAKDCPIYNDEFYDYTYIDPTGSDSEVHAIRLFDLDATPMSGAPFFIRGEGREIRGTTNGDGDALVSNATGPAVYEVFWSSQGADPPPASPEDFDYERTVHIDADSAGSDDSNANVKRLDHFGYSRHPELEENVKDFQIAIGKRGDEVTGVLEDIADELKRRHEELDPPPHLPRSGDNQA